VALVIHSINSTLSGNCYHEDVIADAEHHQYATDLLRSAGLLLLGRRTYDLFVDFWPSATNRRDLPEFVVELARVLTKTPKLVVSTSDLTMPWENTTRVAGPTLEPLRAVLSGHSTKVVLFGSPRLAGSLAAEGLLDEIHVLLQPLFSTRGPQLPMLWRERQFRSLSATRFASGVVLLRYAAEA
jgi:dihydrofolate reductase